MDPDASSTETASENQEQCLVCLNAVRADVDGGDQIQQLWTCSCCRKQCHMLCIFQWTLRLSLNESRHFSAFSCPGCRTQHEISTLPGFAQHTPGNRRTVYISNGRESTADILRQAFGILPANTQLRAEGGDRDEEATAVVEIEAVDDSDEEGEEEDGEDEQGDHVQESGRWMFTLSTQKLYIDVNTVNININSR